MTIKFRIKCVGRDAWSGPDYWNEDFDTLEEAKARIRHINSQNTEQVAPDYYVHAEQDILAVEVMK